MPSALELSPGASPIPAGYRASGLLLPVTSLPSPYGIGDLGPSAYTWIDRLSESGQTWWQMLPLGPTGYGDSPYQCLSSFVGNWMMISPELLIEDGLLSAQECACSFSSSRVEYEAVIPFKRALLEAAWERFRAGTRGDLAPAYEEFRQSKSGWLEDFALFRALKAAYNGAHYLDWPLELAQRAPSAMESARRSLAVEIDQVSFAQFLLFRQGERLKEYARAKGVRLIGDLPFFVSPDSSDVWANPELFLLDDRRRPRFVAGVPPDYFNARGQLWGNPVFDWEVHKQTSYSWCMERIGALLDHVDLIRLDHFRAFAAAWHVPADAPTAETGEWAPGPGAPFFLEAQRKLGSLAFIAEDLGFITPDVAALRDQFHIPGTRVLQFGFDGSPDNIHLPEHCAPNTVVYTGTHDNTTTRHWFGELPEREQRRVWEHLRRPEGDVRDAAPELIRRAWSSQAMVAITPLQDLLNLGKEGRMNVPGRADGNWRWRATQNMISAWNFQWLKDLTKSSNRSRSASFPAMEAAS